MIACFSKGKNKANLYQIKNFTLFKRAVFFIKILFKNAKNRSTKGTPLQALAFAIKNLNWHLQLKKQHLSGSSWFCPFFLNVFNCGICDCMLFKGKKQSKPLPNQKFYLVQKSRFVIKILLKNCKKQVHKGYPLAGLAFAIKHLN